jgi:hypothetical protein
LYHAAATEISIAGSLEETGMAFRKADHKYGSISGSISVCHRVAITGYVGAGDSHEKDI